ncbi:putative G1/S-specific cyclin Pcl5 [Aspergillus clavatus NRRL 1]|uniref:G1/S-specific cyclin Pcl5, putative n=1 Tax=Aspergillus clavatus (strain ATCC 1007 / CBS 513.65 / DSM 816 / NCTC 3887 / NRRL 1 / QM 1276 / 107) TaxID=344612 RepID=A1CMX3_ASPCL|nr:G1/S-specific cyclin Pcl5, putative [Aspergillus clavatus NRRL 1]EAW08910.1 G1/S-specific cyclin Pcl5, putative [Aspergillus clavatus NRRL 1]
MTGMDVLGLNPANPSIQYNAPYAHPYASSISSSASSSSSSVFSLDSLSSQSSISSTSTNPVDVIWENEGEYQVAGRSLTTASGSRVFARGGLPKAADPAVAPELRKHPRRTNSCMVQSNGIPGATRPPPCLLRQSDRKVNFVDNLVDTASQIVEIIWPLSAVASRSDSATGCKGVLPLRTFIQETLRRSRTSYSTLQVALYYLIKIKEHVPRPDATQEQQSRSKPVCRAMQCGRRMFLAALILASKYLQDRNYSARAWSKISGLNTAEINQNELMFLEAVGWRLHVPEATFQRWTDIVLKYTPGAGGFFAADGPCWRTVIPKLTPELNTVDVVSSTPSSLGGFESGFLADSPSPLSSAAPSEQTGMPLGYDQRSAPHQRSSPLSGGSSFLPSMPRPPMLPTPQLTPQTSVASTPAASVSSFTARRASICAAMSQVQNMCMARSTLDQRPSLAFCPRANTFDGYPPAVRRSSLARSTSSASSPDSMISDVSTLSSSSSFSSCSSTASSASANLLGLCASAKPRLAVRATLRCTSNALKECRKTLSVASPISEHFLGDVYSSPEAYMGPVGPMPDLTNFSLGTPVDREAAQSLCELSGAISRPSQTFEPGTTQRSGRKRGRTGSEDLTWQNHVRHLIDLNARHESQAPDGSLRHMLESNPSQPLSALQLSLLNASAPLSGPAGMKRACCGSEARKIALNPSVRSDYLG